MTMVKILQEGLEDNLLKYKGVDPDVQRLFMKHFITDNEGRLVFNYIDQDHNLVDFESFGLAKYRAAVKGIWLCNNVENHFVSTLYISNSCLNLISFSQIFKGRINFTNSAFMSVGLNPNKDLVLKILMNFPNAHFCSLFGNNIIGRITDCKLAHWIRKEDSLFSLHDGYVKADKSNSEESFSFAINDFSLRNYFREIGGRPYLKTFKPRNKRIDNYSNILFFNNF